MKDQKLEEAKEQIQLILDGKRECYLLTADREHFRTVLAALTKAEVEGRQQEHFKWEANKRVEQVLAKLIKIKKLAINGQDGSAVEAYHMLYRISELASTAKSSK